MKNVAICFWIDVSGIPYDTTFVGVIASTQDRVNKANKRLKREVPFLFGKKSAKLNREELLKVIKIIDICDVRMYTSVFKSDRWAMYKNEFGSKKHFKEKIVAYIYYCLIKSQGLYKNFSYNVTTCVESHLGIDLVYKYCKELSESDKIDLSFSTARGVDNAGVKLADYVAKILRSNRVKNVETIRNLTCLPVERDERLLKKLFD
jgi:hypothetical protein